ncbi:N-acyl-D-aspartate/D-glutamate deacylase [Williamsia limnetica]|uniref:N-acyl-D-aspartate/D-glutamate deacylase n=1 Tax=Williamsia limnetica TaxID=882452 RepID=A0A318RG25_WILLI|nr:amidohydrolase family protein [Williamsia limnetica]PYE13076.1 N-acyl-D-aspartate/D-glutamate deacylase [Williamsia limnetica]
MSLQLETSGPVDGGDGGRFDMVVRGGTWFDGTGAPGLRRDLGIRDGKVVEISNGPLPVGPATKVIEAGGQWVMPGFIDVHTHYDAEVLVAPGLGESIRHGVTTAIIGNCSLSTVYTTPVDAADLFSRVEALPRDHVIKALDQGKNWTDPASYIESLEALALGPNIAAFLGHSDIRASVMGLGRATDRAHKPSRSEMAAISSAIEDALDAGFLGVSSMTNPWDKLDGDRYRSRCLPSVYARWSERRKINRILRRRDRVLQTIPNLNTKYDILFFLAGSTGLGRKPLRTSVLAAADAKSDRWVRRIFGPIATLANDLGRGALRWQHLPVPFEVYSDGIDLVVFEEFGSGRAALHLREEMGRNDLLKDPEYRRWFREDFEKKFSSRVWHRDFDDAEITECPDEALVGKTIEQVARERGIHSTDMFLDLVVEHGTDFRWRTVITNDRPDIADWLIKQNGVTIGFSDAGAHLRNMAFYNYGIKLLQRVKEAEHGARTPFLTIEEAIHKLTGELGEFYGLDAGFLRIGDRADFVVVDPAGLTDQTKEYAEEAMPEFGGIMRMVNRNDDAVTATVVAGEYLYGRGDFAPGFGTTLRSGQFLRADQPRGTVKNQSDRPRQTVVG